MDVLPFGAGEAPRRPIAWPPDASDVTSILGLAEVVATGSTVTLPGDMCVEVAGPAYTMPLQFVAWSGRRTTGHRSEAYDLSILVRDYLGLGQADRVQEKVTGFLENSDLDRAFAGPTLLS